MFRGIKSIVRGADHIARDMICQDAGDFREREHYSIAVVADGHGSAKYVRSDIGSKNAVTAAVEMVDAFMSDYPRFSVHMEKNASYLLEKMGEFFLAGWTQRISEHFSQNPLTEEEIKKAGSDTSSVYTYYGSTVLIAVLAEDYYYGMLIGDGGFVVMDEAGRVSIPIEDKNSRANYTSSICSRNAIAAWNSFYRKGKPLLMAVSTDGLIKSFASEEDFMNYHILLSGMLDNYEKCQASLDKNLQRRTTQGSGDDITISVAYDEDRIMEKQDLIHALINQKKEAELENQRRLQNRKRQLANITVQTESSSSAEEKKSVLSAGTDIRPERVEKMKLQKMETSRKWMLQILNILESQKPGMVFPVGNDILQELCQLDDDGEVTVDLTNEMHNEEGKV